MKKYIWENKNWSDFHWDNGRIITSLGECRLFQGKLISKVVSLGISLENQVQAEILVQETQKTSAIEGENLSIRSVRSSVARKLGLPTAGLPVDSRIDNLVAVLLDATQNCNKPFTVERLCGWQASLFPTGYSGLHKIRAGKWRDDKPMRVVSGPIGKERIHFEAPPAKWIDPEIKNLLKWWAKSPGRTDGVVRAAVAHFWFVTIHPFEDGNGRIARALTDMALAQDDKQHIRYYSLSAQIMSEREAYYSILEKCQRGDSDLTEWILWFLGCFSRAIIRSETILAGVFAKADFWKKHTNAAMSTRQRKVINRILDADSDGFEGKLTTRKYASIARVSRPTAFRELSYLLAQGIIRKNPGSGRNVNYDLVRDEKE